MTKNESWWAGYWDGDSMGAHDSAGGRCCERASRHDPDPPDDADMDAYMDGYSIGRMEHWSAKHRTMGPHGERT